MDKKKIFMQLRKEDKKALIALLENAYDCLSAPEALSLFSPYYEKSFDKKSFIGRTVADIDKFSKDSYAGHYYAPFEINSKNFMDVPEETELWFDLLAEYFKKTITIFEKGELKMAADCFAKLYKLLDDMGNDEIVFADELGGYMLPIEHKQVMPKYIKALASARTPKEYAEEVVKLMHGNEYGYGAPQVYGFAKRIGGKDQKAALKQRVSENELLMRRLKKL